MKLTGAEVSWIYEMSKALKVLSDIEIKALSSVNDKTFAIAGIGDVNYSDEERRVILRFARHSLALSRLCCDVNELARKLDERRNMSRWLGDRLNDRLYDFLDPADKKQRDPRVDEKFWEKIGIVKDCALDIFFKGEAFADINEAMLDLISYLAMGDWPVGPFLTWYKDIENLATVNNFDSTEWEPGTRRDFDASVAEEY